MADARLDAATLRAHAISQSLFTSSVATPERQSRGGGSLQLAIDRLGFVQADPIRAPARAQDLILRHRVVNYRAGDLERQYSSLEVEEDYLYAYGFLSKPVWELLHPRKTGRVRSFEKKVLETVMKLGDAHPRALEPHLGTRRVINAWGGYSKATTHALEWLHWRGLLRIARRENGIRVYQPATLPGSATPPAERLRALILVYARIFAPAPEKSLRSVIVRHRELGDTRETLAAMIRRGELRKATVDGVSYVWPAGEVALDVPRQVRFLAPFDPVVWDRTRFEHLWGWAYRFEAYTPVKKRVRGYYALPVLWCDEFTGWANATSKAGKFDIHIGYVNRRPRGADFRRELDAEIVRLSEFLTLADD